MRAAIALTLCSLAASAARADVPPQAAARLLSAYHARVDDETLRALGPGWDAAMIALLGDEATRPLVRARAVIALGHAKTPAAAAALRRVLAAGGAATEGAPVVETRNALRALARLEGPSATADLVRFSGHAVPDVRAAAAEALGIAGGAAALDAVRARLRREPEPSVRAALEAARGRLQAR